MRDIEFLATRPAFAGTLIYRYRSGVLRPQVREALREVASQEGRDLSGCERDELLSTLGGGFFSDLYWCDWTALTPSSASTAKLDAILAHIVAIAGDRFALFVPMGSELLSHSLWPEVEKVAGLVLEEELVTQDTLMPALRLFQSTTDLATGVDWLAVRAFAESFAMFRGRKKRTLLELRHAFDERVAACTDAESHAFLPDVYRSLFPDERRSAATSALRSLRMLLARRRGWDCFDLVRALDERYGLEGWSTRSVVAELHRVTRKVITEPGRTDARGGAFEAVGAIDLALWMALLLSWDERFRAIIATDAVGYRRRPDGLVVALNSLGRNFLARADLDIEVDPLAGAWAGLDLALIRMVNHPTDALASARGATVEALSHHLRRATARVPWLLRLKRRIRRAIAEAKAAEAEQAPIEGALVDTKGDD